LTGLNSTVTIKETFLEETMYYTFLLSLHSITRWFLIIFAVYAIYLAFKGIMEKSAWTQKENLAGMLFASAADLQLLLGLILYFFLSPITTSALRDFGGAMANAGTRFFAVEHSLVMVVGLVLVHIGRVMSKNGKTDLQKHQRAAVWFLIALVIILLAIPWPFMSAGRPLLRFG
jgi:uncharacterized membrane protein YozB (DUF420 family)